MRALVDMVDSFAGIVRFIIGAVFLFGFLLILVVTAGTSYIAPKVAEEAGERATHLGERAIAEARQAQRDQELAQDGWGYGSSDVSQNGNIGPAPQGQYRSGGGDWGEETR